MTAAAVASGASGWSFFRRELSSEDSRLVAVSAAVVAAIVAAISLRTWTSVWGAVAITAIAAIPILVFRLSQKMSGLTGAVMVWLIVACASVSDARFLLLGLIALLGAGLLRWAEQRRALRRAALLGAIRDAAWRMTGLIVVAIASLAAADRVERAVFEASFGTPLEGLALSSGIAAGALLFLALGIAVWSLPRIAAKRMRAGLSLPSAATDALWFGTILGAVAIGFDLRAIAATGPFSEALGRNSWIAIASAFAFAATRLGTPALIRPDIQPLWIVVVGERWVLRYAADLAARWDNGPVTIVAAPEVAPRMRGVHLRLAQSRGELHALFPQRPIHLADWLDTLPPRDRWETLPVRELYCEEPLWSDLFETQLETTAAVVVALGPGAEPVTDRLHMLPIGRTDLHVLGTDDRVFTRRMDEGGIKETKLDAWIAATALPREKSKAVRFALVAYAKRDEDFAQGLVRALRGAVDGRGLEVRPGSVVFGGTSTGLALLLRRADITYWLQGVGLQKLRRTTRGREPFGITRLFVRLLLPRSAEYDLLIIEGEDVLTDDVWKVVNRNAIEEANRVISVTDDGAPSSKAADFAFNGIIRYPAAAVVEAQIEEIQRRYLALDFDPVFPPPQSTAQAPPAEGSRPRVYLSYGPAYEKIATILRWRLRSTCDVVTDDSINLTEVWDRALRRMVSAADAVIAIVGPDPESSRIEASALAFASGLGKPILPIMVGPYEPGMVGVPMNFIQADLANAKTDEEIIRGLDVVMPAIDEMLIGVFADRAATLRP